MYLDEMLTRELIKLDDIETEGKENVRQARKNAIKSIQNSISLLESKASLAGQEQGKTSGDEPVAAQETPKIEEAPVPAEKMETEMPHSEAIPLPPCPSPEEKRSEATSQDSTVAKAPAEALPSKNAENGVVLEDKKVDEDKAKEEAVPESAPVAKMEEKVEDQDEMSVEDKRSLKKGRKKKKPEPVSEQAIPLPPPESVNK